ncbi:hypothetical protein ACXWQK_08780, partial [Streptococcus pyogenes]
TEAAMVLVLFLIGERLEGYAASRARDGIQSLMALVVSPKYKAPSAAMLISVSIEKGDPLLTSRIALPTIGASPTKVAKVNSAPD